MSEDTKIIKLPVIRIERHHEDDDELIRLADRHDFLMRNPPRCIKCDSEQVQMKGRNVPAEWRCRICKHRFQFEPEQRVSAVETVRRILGKEPG